MSGYQSSPYPQSRPARLQQRNGGAIVDTADPEREPDDFGPGAAVGLVFLVAATFVIAVGGIGWLLGVIP